MQASHRLNLRYNHQIRQAASTFGITGMVMNRKSF